MAFGKLIEVDQATEGDVRLDADRAIILCTGTFPNGTQFRFNDGELQVKGPGAPDFAVANGGEVAQVRAALEKKFGSRRIDLDERGRFILRDTPGPSAVEQLAQGFRERVYDFNASANLEKAQDMGLVSFIREKVDEAIESRPDIEEEARRRFKGPANLDELIKLSYNVATDKKAQLEAAEAFVKKEKLVDQIVRRVRAGEDRNYVLLSVRKDIERTRTYNRAPGEVQQIMDVATEAAKKAYNKAQDKAAAKRESTNKWNRRFMKVPFSPQRQWDGILERHQIISTLRLMEQQEVDGDTAWETIEGYLHEAGVARSEEIADYAFAMFGNEAFRAKLQKKFITANNIDAAVAMSLRAGQSRANIEADLEADFDAQGRSGAEITELINRAFERAEAHERKMNMRSDFKSFLPLTDERTWDDFLTDHGIFTRVRYLKANGTDDVNIRHTLMSDPNIVHHPKQQAILEYAIRWADSRFMIDKVADRIVAKRKLGEEVVRLQKAGTTEADIKLALRPMLDLDTDAEEVDAIFEAAFARAGSIKNREHLIDVLWRDRVQNVKDAAKFVAKGVRNNVIPGFLGLPKNLLWNWPKAGINWVRSNPDKAKTIAKYSALGVAIAGISTGALVVGGVALGVYGIKKAAPLALNVGKHLVTDGATLVGAVAKTAIVNPIKATGRIVSSPFKRGYQAARWATNYITKPTVKKPKGWTSPFTWMNNKLKGAWYRSKQGALALAAGSLFSIYGAGEGIANATSKDLLGLDAEIPELSIFHAPSGGHGGHEDHGAAHGGDHGGDHGHAAAHGGGHH